MREEGSFILASWNLHSWTEDRMEGAMGLGADFVAVQETRLATVPLNRAQRLVQSRGWALHHGMAVKEVRGELRGSGCGVGFLVAPGRAVAKLHPTPGAWQRLNAMGRIHAVRVPDAEGPGGLRVVSVYAPLAKSTEERRAFGAAMWDMVVEWDMQEPTLLVGDFNGTVSPWEDYSKGDGQVCPLLSKLVGVGGPFVEVKPATKEWTFEVKHQDEVFGSRIDLCLANRAALSRVESVEVKRMPWHGHAALLIKVRGRTPQIDWEQGRRVLPEKLKGVVEGSEEWAELLTKLEQSDPWKGLSERGGEMGREELARALDDSLEEVVKLAGGWDKRPRRRRKAYASPAMARMQKIFAECNAARAEAKRFDGIGSWPRKLVQRLGRLGLSVSGRAMADVQWELTEMVEATRASIGALIHAQRQERLHRWKDRVAELWRRNPGAVHRWLNDNAPAWGTSPVVNGNGKACSTPAEVDAEVRGFWVNQVLRKHEGVNGEQAWLQFLSSEFAAHVPRMEWPVVEWTADLVVATLRRMRASASPGSRGIPIAVWKAMPAVWQMGCAADAAGGGGGEMAGRHPGGIRGHDPEG